jgi:hypothetical protein
MKRSKRLFNLVFKGRNSSAVNPDITVRQRGDRAGYTGVISTIELTTGRRRILSENLYSYDENGKG